MHPDLGPSCRLVSTLVAAVPEKSLDDPTPCRDLAVAGLLAHLHGLAQAFTAAARKNLGPLTDTSPQDGAPELLAQWREETQAHLAALAEAWDDDGAWKDMTRAGGVDLPGEVAGMVALDEVVVHGWDLAVSTGQDYAPDDATVQVLEQMLVQWRRDGVPPEIFGPEVAVAPGAPALHHVIGLAGRDPLWQPS